MLWLKNDELDEWEDDCDDDFGVKASKGFVFSRVPVTDLGLPFARVGQGRICKECDITVSAYKIYKEIQDGPKNRQWDCLTLGKDTVDRG